MGLIDDKKRVNEIEALEERAILVGLITPQQGEAKAKEYLDELEFLAETAGATTVRTFLQRCDGPNSTSYVGKGKLEEIVAYVQENDISLVIFDDDLTPKQVAFIEKAVQVKTLDRTSLILDIFAKRAQTASAKMQVELAQYQYLLPRLAGMWTHLERQRGGIGSVDLVRRRSRPTAVSSRPKSPCSRRNWPSSTSKRLPNARTAANSPASPSWVIPMWANRR